MPLPEGLTPSVETEVIEKRRAATQAAQSAAAAGASTSGNGASPTVESPWQHNRSAGTAGCTGADGFRLSVAFRDTRTQGNGSGASHRHAAESAWASAGDGTASASSSAQQGNAGSAGKSAGDNGAAEGSAASNGGGAVGPGRSGLLGKLLPWRKRVSLGEVASSTSSAPDAAAPKVEKPKIPSAFRRALASALHVRTSQRMCAQARMSVQKLSTLPARLCQRLLPRPDVTCTVNALMSAA